MELQSGLKKAASYRRKLPRKAKNIYLPTEVWVDVFCFPWNTRPRMAQMVDKIGNRWFGEQLQFYLHEWGKHTLGELHFEQQGVSKWHSGLYRPLEYPQTAMPENIKFCESFQIHHFDNRVFNFFRRIQSLLTADTKLDIRYIPSIFEQLGNVRTILGHLLPFMDGVHTISTDDQMLPLVKEFPPEKFSQIKVLDVVVFPGFVQSAMQPAMEWLTTSSNEPKFLHLCCVNDEIDQQALETIRQQFIEATEPSTFAVVFRNNRELNDFHRENGIGEQLDGIRKGSGRFEVFRHQANNAEAREQLRHWLKENTDKEGECTRKPCIGLYKPTIGHERIFAMPDLDEEEANDEKEEDDDEKPSTSKKRRICE